MSFIIRSLRFFRSKKIQKTQFYIDCAVPVNDSVMELDSFVTFLTQKIKVNGKAGALGEAVKVTAEGTKVVITAAIAFSKVYLKYLTKKYLKQQQLRNHIQVLSANKATYRLKYYAFEAADEE